MNSKYHPHNVFKFCPKCGQKSLVQHCEKSQKCSKCNFLFYTNSAGAVAAIIKNNKGKVLLTTRAFDPGKGMLDLPGGFVDPNESVEQALVREVKEELNLDVVSWKYLGSSFNEYVYKDVLYYTHDMIFECQVKTLEGIKVDDDVSGYDFYNINDQIIQQVGLDSIKRILSEYKE